MLLLPQLYLVLRPLAWSWGLDRWAVICSTMASSLLIKFLGHHVLSPGSLTNCGGSGRGQMLRVADGSLVLSPPAAWHSLGRLWMQFYRPWHGWDQHRERHLLALQGWSSWQRLRAWLLQHNMFEVEWIALVPCSVTGPLSVVQCTWGR